MANQYGETVPPGLSLDETVDWYLRTKAKPNSSGCWIVRKGGRPKFKFQGKLDYAYRWVARAKLGLPPSSDSLVMHICDDGRCVNPAHLQWGSNVDNVKDSREKDRFNRGDRRPSADRTPEEIREIRKLREDGWTLERIGRKYGISAKAIHNIVNKKRWGWVK